MTTEMKFRAMGSDCHVMVVGGPVGLIDIARNRIDQLEQRWSRFLPDSEVSTLNRRAGTPLLVSDDTSLLIRRAIDAKMMTDGLFEPTVLGDMIRAGYDRPFDQLTDRVESPITDLGQGPITVIGPTVMLAPGTGFDPGGIGKGLAADLVAEQAKGAGAAGICVNLGGDVRVSGIAPDGGDWTVSIDHPHRSAPLAVLGVAEGAVATTTRLIRQWTIGDRNRHHLIDPATGDPSQSDLALVTAVAGQGWVAETHSKAALLAGSERCFDLMRGTGIEGLAITNDGEILTTPGFGAFAGDQVPDHVDLLESLT
jgi:FAD:protein FMN transferase